MCAKHVFWVWATNVYAVTFATIQKNLNIIIINLWLGNKKLVQFICHISRHEREATRALSACCCCSFRLQSFKADCKLALFWSSHCSEFKCAFSTLTTCKTCVMKFWIRTSTMHMNNHKHAHPRTCTRTSTRNTRTRTAKARVFSSTPTNTHAPCYLHR